MKRKVIIFILDISESVNDIEEYLKNVRFVIMDETHKVAARSYYQLGLRLPNTEYRLGMSGTAKRDDGNDMMINAVVGYKVFDLGARTLIENGWLMEPNIHFIKDYIAKDVIDVFVSECKQGLINETAEYSVYYNKFIKDNMFRNDLIKNIILKHSGKKILVLVKLVEHGELLERTIEGSKYIHGSLNKEERKAIYNEFVLGSIKVLIGTIGIFSEGIDIPDLDIIINASANKGDVKTIQMLGRVLRKIEGKEECKYIDFVDESGFFKHASLSRIKALKREGHEVMILKNQ